jgi:uncharacterized protein YbjT (DUF2867 family)
MIGHGSTGQYGHFSIPHRSAFTPTVPHGDHERSSRRGQEYVERIFVSGATGTTGGATVRALRNRGIDVVADVRTPEKAGALEALGATVRPFDLADANEMADAMRGSGGLYLVTPVSERTAELTQAMVEAAKVAGIRHIVKLSGLDIDKEPRFTMGDWHLAAEQSIAASGIAWTFLRPNSFMQNFLGNAGSIKAQSIYYSPFGSTPVAFVDAQDIGEVAATVLSSEGHEGRTYNLTGPRGIAKSVAGLHHWEGRRAEQGASRSQRISASLPAPLIHPSYRRGDRRAELVRDHLLIGEGRMRITCRKGKAADRYEGNAPFSRRS